MVGDPNSRWSYREVSWRSAITRCRSTLAKSRVGVGSRFLRTASPADNEFFFVYDKEVVRRTLIVSDQGEAVRPIEFAAGVSPDPDVVCSVEVVPPDQVIAGELDEVALLVWHAPIPAEPDPAADMLQEFANRGGRILFLPTAMPTAASFAGVRWLQWSDSQESQVTTWVGDRDLLANTRSGEALPLGDLQVFRNCLVQGEFTALATLNDGQPFLVRAMTAGGNVYFCGTTASPADSSLASGGVVLYAMLHRAIDAGARSLGNAQQFIAGAVPLENNGQWRQLAGPRDAISSEYALHAGVYQLPDRLFAINRSEAEDLEVIVPDGRVAALFGELDFSRVDGQVGNDRTLIQEVWRLFLVMMLIALLLEAVLCLPRRVAKKGNVSLGGATA